jgi:hypothetical protein
MEIKPSKYAFLEYYKENSPGIYNKIYIYNEIYHKYQNDTNIIQNALFYWNKDLEEGEDLGQYFSVYVWKLFGLEDEPMNLNEDLMREAAIRDLIISRYLM